MNVSLPAFVVALLSGFAPAAAAQAPAAPPRIPTAAELDELARQYGDRWTPEARVYRAAGPAVVTVHGYRAAKSPLSGIANLRPERPISQASGVVLDQQGFVITNAHVVAPDEDEPDDQLDCRISFSPDFGGASYAAELLSLDREWDLALLKIRGDGPFPALALAAADEFLIGERVIALGAPLGSSLSLTTGVLSGIGRDILVAGVRATHRLSGVLQTDAAINPGNSGGPLLDARGALIGINSATLSGAAGISYAIPAGRVREILETRLYRPRVWLGMAMVPQTLTVERLHPRGPAARGGLREGDRLLRLDDDELSDFPGLQRSLLTRRAGESVLVAYERGSGDAAARGIARVELAADEARWMVGVLGFRPSAEKLKLPVPERSGDQFLNILRVEEVFSGSGAESLGLVPGDTIIAVRLLESADADGWTPVQSVQQLREFVEGGRLDFAGLNLWWLKRDGSSLKGRLTFDDPWLTAASS